MHSAVQPLTALSLLVVAPALLGGGCGITVDRPSPAYSFAHPLLNERWPAAGRAVRKEKVRGAAATASARKKSVASKSASNKTSAKAAVAAVQPPPAQELRGEELEVVRQEMVLAARRLLGIGDSFTQDSFVRHLLLVNNLELGELPEEGAVGWLFRRGGEELAEGSSVAPGDLLFLGEKEPQACVVVEEAAGDGQVTFIGYIGGKVERGVLSLTQREVRRSEEDGRIINSFVGKSTLAGQLLVGQLSLARHQGGLAAKVP